MLTIHKYHIAIGFIFLSFIPSCKRNNSPSVQQIDPTVEKYFSYKPGTYWIYYDSVSGETDSFAVTSVETTTLPAINNGISYVSERDLIGGFHNGKNDSIGIYWTLEYQIITINYEEYSYSNNVVFTFNYPYQSPDTIYPTYQLYGNIYDSVARFSDTSINALDVFYISTNAGIIKMNLNNPSNPIFRKWELQRYSIIH